MSVITSQGKIRELAISLNYGSVELLPGNTKTITGEVSGNEDIKLQQNGDQLYLKIRGRSQADVRLEVPEDLGLNIKLGFAEFRAGVRVDAAQIKIGSGDIYLRELRDGRIASGQGNVHIARVLGKLSCRTGNGTVSVGSLAGSLDFRGGRGQIDVGIAPELPAKLNLRSGIGRVDIALQETTSRGQERYAIVDAATGTGDIRIYRAGT